MNGPMNGTSISDLNMSGGMTGMASNMPSMSSMSNMPSMSNMGAMQNIQYDAMQMRQGEENHNSINRIEQAQHYPYYDIPGLKYPQYPQDQMLGDIEDLARDIGDNLPKGGYEQFDSDSDVSIDEGDDEEKSTGILSWIPTPIIESLLLIFIFVILSQPFVRDNIGKYIKQINPDASGNVSLLGIFIYGTVLAVLFQLAKMLFM